MTSLVAGIAGGCGTAGRDTVMLWKRKRDGLFMECIECCRARHTEPGMGWNAQQLGRIALVTSASARAVGDERLLLQTSVLDAVLKQDYDKGTSRRREPSQRQSHRHGKSIHDAVCFCSL